MKSTLPKAVLQKKKYCRVLSCLACSRDTSSLLQACRRDDAVWGGEEKDALPKAPRLAVLRLHPIPVLLRVCEMMHPSLVHRVCPACCMRDERRYLLSLQVQYCTLPHSARMMPIGSTPIPSENKRASVRNKWPRQLSPAWLRGLRSIFLWRKRNYSGPTGRGPRYCDPNQAELATTDWIQ